jgi:hypothetical protein
MSAREIFISISLILVLFCTSSFAKYSGGSGEPNNPYLIATPNDLNSIELHPEDMNKCFLMTADINMIEFTGDQFNYIGINSEFRGVFNGNGHAIYNFTFIGDAGGLFVTVNDANARIEGVTMVDPNVQTDGQVAALVLSMYYGKIIDCHIVGGVVRGESSVGGLCGDAGGESLEIIGCTSSADVYGWGFVGGLIGESYDGNIIDSHATGDVHGSDGYVGGLIGSCGEITIQSCSAAGYVKSGDRYAGGLIAESDDCNIIDCHATGDVNGYANYVGGLIGRSVATTIQSCSAIGDVNGNYFHVGGLLGYGEETTIQRCSASGNVKGYEEVGGLVGDLWLGQIVSSHAAGDVAGQECYAGGLVGVLSGTIEECYAAGNVSAECTVGGLVACAEGGPILKSFSTGSVSGSGLTVGGLIGGAYANISNCYSLSNVTGGNEDGTGGLYGESDIVTTNCYFGGYVDSNGLVGGLVGYSYEDEYMSCFWDRTKNPDVNGVGDANDPNVIGLPTSEMQRRSTFAGAGWDIINIWDIGENQTYPFLRTHLPSDINKDGETNLYDLAILAENWLGEW